MKETILDALDKAIAPAPKPNTLIQFGKAVAGFDLTSAPTKDELGALRAAQADWKKAFEAMSLWNDQYAYMRFSAQMGDGRDHTADGPNLVRTRGLESFVSEHAGKRLAAESKMTAASSAAARVATGFVRRFVPVAESWLATREKAEKAEAEAFGLEYTATPLTGFAAEFVRGLRKLADNGMKGAQGARPSDMLPFISME